MEPPRFEDVSRFIAEFHQVEPAWVARHLYSFEGLDAVRHLFRMVSSLDSMVVGESQILGQAKQGLSKSKAMNISGRELDNLFQHAFAVAKDIHSSTGIASGRLSVGSTAVDLARQIFSRFDDKRVLMVGAGKMGELALTHLLETKPKQLFVTNRTNSRAVELAERLSSRHAVDPVVVPYSDWIERVAEVDIVITSTGASEAIVTAQQFKDVPKQRGYRPLLIVDIGVPRDIDPAVGEHNCVFLYDIDDLQTVTEGTVCQRKEAVAHSQRIIEAKVIEFAERQGRRDLGPVISALREHFRQIGDAELERILPKLHGLSEHDHEHLGEMLHRLINKLLHRPMHLLSKQGDPVAAQVYADALQTIFGLNEVEESEADSAEPREASKADKIVSPSTPASRQR
jgi:glutamyl-tRNA reductase